MLTPEQRKNFKIDPLIKFCFDYILPISEDRVLATHGSQISLITKSGEMLCTHDSIDVPTYDTLDSVNMDEAETILDEQGRPQAQQAGFRYVEGILRIVDDGLYGLIDYDGIEILPPKFITLEFNGPSSMITL